MFESYNLITSNNLLLIFYVFIYNIACAIFLPTPSEAPMLLYKKVPLPIIILISAFGKGLGAYIVCRTWATLDKTLKKFRLSFLFWPKARIERYIRGKGFIAYLIMQSIPFMPMRSSIYIFSYISQNGKQVAIGAIIGTILRNIIMLLLFYFGYLSIQGIF